MKRLVEELKTRPVLVSDGAWGTLMQEQGIRPGDCMELWCLERRDVVLDIARRYIEAGADLIKSNSFGANRFKLEHHGLQGRVAEFNRAAAAISREAAGPDRHVIASVGPTGKFLLMGDVSEEAVYEAFRDQLTALEAGGADAGCIETFTAIDEAVLAVKAAREHTQLEVICTFTFEKNARGEYRTMMGVSPTDAARALVAAGAHLIGANCGNGMAQMVDIVKEMRAAAPGTPIVVHANAGLPVSVNGVTTYPEQPEETARQALAVVAAGAGIVGGCCGTTPAHIRALVGAVRARRG